MSKMADLSIEIKGMLQDGYLTVTIARELEIPVTWIFEEIEQDELSPFETINSYGNKNDHTSNFYYASLYRRLFISYRHNAWLW